VRKMIGVPASSRNCFGRFAGHPGALPSGGYDCDVHKKVTGNE